MVCSPGNDDDINATRRIETSAKHNVWLLTEMQRTDSARSLIQTPPNTHFSNNTVRECWAFARKLYPDRRLEEASNQGGCSFTLLCHCKAHDPPSKCDCLESTGNRTLVLQFRRRKHALAMDIVDTAMQSSVWTFAPKLANIGSLKLDNAVTLHAYQMSFVDGINLTEVLPRTKQLDGDAHGTIKAVLLSLANHFIGAFGAGQCEHMLVARKHGRGKIGSTIFERLCQLECDLPTDELRATARNLRESVGNGRLNFVPLSLTHGDLLPSNIIVDAETGFIKGIIDWAEAEYLPFGLNLYAVEHVLGFTELDTSTGVKRFVYYDQATMLREFFWLALRGRMQGLLVQDTRVYESVLLARKVGIMLWHGFAWDDGNLDRVVNPVDDAEEMEYLRAILSCDTMETTFLTRICLTCKQSLSLHVFQASYFEDLQQGIL